MRAAERLRAAGRALGRATQSAKARGRVAECHRAATAAGITTADERDQWIRANANVWPLASIGRVWGLTRQRVHQIVRATSTE